jgi:hypothetical protein
MGTVASCNQVTSRTMATHTAITVMLAALANQKCSHPEYLGGASVRR